MWKVCAICGKGFESRFPNAVYCSPKCRYEAKRKYREDHKEERKAKIRETMLTTCAVCGKEFYKDDSHKKYCSIECRAEGEHRMQRLYMAEKRKSQREDRTYLEAIHSGKPLDENSMAKVLNHYASDEDLALSKRVKAEKAKNKSVRMRRKQNMLLLAQDIVEADKLGISYGQYQAMKGK